MVWSLDVHFLPVSKLIGSASFVNWYSLGTLKGPDPIRPVHKILKRGFRKEFLASPPHLLGVGLPTFIILF